MMPSLCHWLQIKIRFGMAKLPFCPVRYRLTTQGRPDFFYRWTKVMPFIDPEKGAADFSLWGWDVRELRFLRRFLRPGMQFLDVGAHHGLYAVLARKMTGVTGRVAAVEPAPSVRCRLKWHLWLNGAGDVRVFPCVVGAQDGTATLHIPTGGVDTVSSLRPQPTMRGGLKKVRVDMRKVDGLAREAGLDRLDLVKLDVEGAEEEALDGAGEILAQQRPIWLFEALDATGSAWGSSGRALVRRFQDGGHRIYQFRPDGQLEVHAPREQYPLDSNCNLLAVPKEKESMIRFCLAHD